MTNLWKVFLRLLRLSQQNYQQDSDLSGPNICLAVFRYNPKLKNASGLTVIPALLGLVVLIVLSKIDVDQVKCSFPAKFLFK